jgi:hypothetical protein
MPYEASLSLVLDPCLGSFGFTVQGAPPQPLAYVHTSLPSHRLFCASLAIVPSVL